jgi:Zn-dependent protease with chaperone function
VQGPWPLSAVRISPRLGRTPRILQVPGGGRIEVPDTPVLDQWFGGAPSRIEAAADWLERRRTAIVAAAGGVVAAIVLFVGFGLPWAAGVAARHVPAAAERTISDQVLVVMGRWLSPSRVPAARQAGLREAFGEMVAGEPRAQDMRLHFTAGASAIGANAFALPDGRIYVTDDLVDLAKSDGEVLAVLAHEAGHHVHRHGMRNALEHSSVFLLAGLLVGDISGSSLAVALPAVLVSSRFSRGHEAEADRYAFDLLQRDGQSPQAFADIMRRLAGTRGGDGEGEEGGLVGMLSSHPPTPARIRAAEEAAAAFDAGLRPSSR